MNTAAILSAYTLAMVYAVIRARRNVEESIGSPGPACETTTMAPITAAAANNIARNSTALPKYTVEKLIFPMCQAIAQNADKPEKRDTGDRHQVQCEESRTSPSAKPNPRLERVSGHRAAKQPKKSNKKQRKGNARDGCSFGRS